MPDEIRLANDADDLAARDAYLEDCAAAFDAIFPGFGDVLRDTWQAIRPILTPCDCPLNPYHRWNCTLTPIWSQTIRDLDTNPHTVIDGALRAPRKAIS